MQPYENTVVRKLIKLDPAVRAGYEESAAKLKAERVAQPPGPGNLRTLKKQAEKDARAALYQSLADDGPGARKYDLLYARAKGVTTRD